MYNERITYNDLTLRCADCTKAFTFSAEEQDLFAQKGFTNKPGRCPECRAARKASGRSGPSPGYRTPGERARR
jgi:hypothetical protein